MYLFRFIIPGEKLEVRVVCINGAQSAAIATEE